MTNTPASSATAESNDSSKPKEDDRPPWWIFATFLIVAIIVLASLAWTVGSATLLFVELLLAAASSCIGGLLGFLFGMPRGPADVSPDSSEDGASDLQYRPGNNLEQISDWLTKILIGVGLVELGEMRTILSQIGQAVALSVAAAPATANVVSQVVIVTFLIVGFLVSFLWTRIYYGPLQTRVDKGVIDSLRGQLRREKEEKEKAVAVVRDLATGEKPVATVSPAKDKRTDRSRSVTPVEGQWSDEVAQKIEKFKQSPRTWNSNPGDRLFPGAPQEKNGRRLEAEMVLDLDDAVMIDLRVVRVSGENLTGTVAFLLHPTFSEPILYAEPADDVAEERISASGWFTVVAIADNGDTVLSFDLRNLPNAPAWFKKR